MARYEEQLICDYLNLAESHEKVEYKLKRIFNDNIVLKYGTSTHTGIENVMQFMEETAKAISSPWGFQAIPIVIVDTEIPELGVTTTTMRCAIALLSKLENYISWFFFVQKDAEKISSIIGTRGMGYKYYKDLYSKKGYY